ncbi:hypothetical protein BDF21DRAFT_425853 [Thamnidium elegans]|nr:hypothetical protein BDF21DRAFT_425853 [Thamnidium elegans]
MYILDLNNLRSKKEKVFYFYYYYLFTFHTCSMAVKVIEEYPRLSSGLLFCFVSRLWWFTTILWYNSLV